MKEGLLVLGRVKNLFETKVVVSLPCRLIGSVMACHISEPYNKELEAYVNDKVGILILDDNTVDAVAERLTPLCVSRVRFKGHLGNTDWFKSV